MFEWPRVTSGDQERNVPSHRSKNHLKMATDEWSDIDIVIVSPDFSDDLLKERLILTKLAIPIDDRIEPKPFNKESFNPNDPLVYEIP